MYLAALALGLVLQNQPVADAADAAEPALEGAAALLPPPPPTDAPTLIADIQQQWSAYGELAAELAARQARERYLSELVLPVISRPDLDDGAQGEILRELGGTMNEVERSNTSWAVSQLDPDTFGDLYARQPRLARQLLRFAERDEAAEGRVINALRPVAMAGLIDGPDYAVRADTWRVAQGRRQLYGTVEICVDGQLDLAEIGQPAALAERRAALDLPPMSAIWTEDRDRSCVAADAPADTATD